MKITKAIQNLKCGGCAHTIISSLNGLDNISDIQINAETSEVSFSYLTEADGKAVYQKLKRLGYPVIDDENSLGLKAKSYISCAIGKINK